jgi:hypothetical protein
VQSRRSRPICVLIRGRLSRAPRLARWVLDERDDAACHEPRSADRLAGARHLDYLNDAAPGRDLHAAPGASSHDLVGTRTVVCSHDNFDAIASHLSSVVH